MERQIDLIEDGKKVVQETRRWDDDKEYSYPMRSKEDAQDYRYFPEPDLAPIVISDEWLDEISPAHIFSRSIHGEGFRMRKSFENGILNYRKYDSCLENALTVESPESLCKIALNRLRLPSRLEDIFREKYENVIKKYMGTAFTLAVKDQDFPMLHFICEHFSPDMTVLSEAMEHCIETDWSEGNAFLMEQKHNTFSEKTFEFDLDF